MGIVPEFVEKALVNASQPAVEKHNKVKINSQFFFMSIPIRMAENHYKEVDSSTEQFESEKMSELDVIVVAPHPDDAELGMGGAILKMIDDGLRVGVLDLTSGEPTPHGSLEIRKAETEKASAVLGLSWRRNLGMPNRSLEPTLENRKAIAEVFSRSEAEMDFCTVLGRCPS